MLDLDAYLERVGLSGRPDVDEVHRAHSTTVPFENLDPHAGIPVSLADEDLERKLVTGRRGGYCFEHNMLLRAALLGLGAEVEMYLARVRMGAPAGTIRPRSHLVLQVRGAGASVLADVGFGLGTLLEPIPWAPGGEYEQSGWRYRLVDDGSERVLQTLGEDGWSDLYGFVPTPVPVIDVETSNWWVCTHPRSPFVTGLVAGIQNPDGARTLLSDWDELALTEQTPASSSVTPVERARVPELLASRFGLEGFELDGEERVRRSAA